MRIAVAALCVLALTGPAGAVETCHGHSMPPQSVRQEPGVEYDVRRVSFRRLQKLCSPTGSGIAETWGCAYQNKDSSWTILLSASLTPEQYSCMLVYEKAHLPPFYWADPGIERKDAIDWLAGQKRSGR